MPEVLNREEGVMICSCGASCRTSEVQGGTAHTCPACGRRTVVLPNLDEVWFSPPFKEPSPVLTEMLETVGKTAEMFAMPPELLEPRKRRK